MIFFCNIFVCNLNPSTANDKLSRLENMTFFDLFMSKNICNIFVPNFNPSNANDKLSRLENLTFFDLFMSMMSPKRFPNFMPTKLNNQN